MGKYYLILAILIIKFSSSIAQVEFSMLEQGFEDPIISSGVDSEFLPGWLGNDVRTTSSRIFISDRARSGERALGIQALASFTIEITIKVDLREIEAPVLQFYAHSAQNGSGSRPAIIDFATSLDGGFTYDVPQQIPSNSFPNNNLTHYQKYLYNLPIEAGLNEDVRVKMTIAAGEGTGTVARVFMDDFLFFHDPDYVPPYIPLHGDIRINEFMSKPDPVIDLPNAEYIELYNTTGHVINLSGFTLSNDVRTSTMSYYQMEPYEYLILAPHNNASLFEEFGNVLGLTSWPILKNEADMIILKDRRGNIIDQVSYHISWFNDFEKRNGGWSLELIDPFSKCFGEDIWKPSVHPHGGSPGEQNSVFGEYQNNIPTSIVSAKALNDETVQITFDKGVSENGLSTHQVKINGKNLIEKIISGADRKSFTLYLVNGFNLEIGELYQIKIDKYEDCTGLISESLNTEIGIGRTPIFNELIISEIMTRPLPAVQLPESQYLEFVNRTQALISLKDIRLASPRSFTLLPDANIQPQEKIILCPRNKAEEFSRFGRVIGLTSWPNLNVTRDEIMVTFEDDIIFHISYEDSWYQNSSKKSGGWSLEMVDLNNPCSESSNWKASENTLGGTPGTKNSVKENNPDLQAPEIDKVVVRGPNSVSVSFTEKISHAHFNKDKVSINKNIKIKEVGLVRPQLNRIELILEENLLPKEVYTLTISGVRDCAGNIQSESSDTFVLPEKSGYQDIVINEVLSNPKVGGVKFVEIYNKSDKNINLKDWKLANRSNGNPANHRTMFNDDFIAEPGAHLAFTTDTEVLFNNYPKAIKGHLTQMTLPSYPISEGDVLLVDPENNIIDEFHYKEEFHHPLIRDPKGVSLERIRAESNTNDANNWKSASAEHNYSTPGYKNSQLLGQVEGSAEIVIEPKVISPEITGFDDFTTIHYNLDQAGYSADIYITDVSGRLIKTISSNNSIGSSGFFTWDGTDNNRQRVRMGYYIVYVKLFSMNGESKILKDKVLVGGRF